MYFSWCGSLCIFYACVFCKDNTIWLTKFSHVKTFGWYSMSLCVCVCVWSNAAGVFLNLQLGVCANCEHVCLYMCTSACWVISGTERIDCMCAFVCVCVRVSNRNVPLWQLHLPQSRWQRSYQWALLWVWRQPVSRRGFGGGLWRYVSLIIHDRFLFWHLWHHTKCKSQNQLKLFLFHSAVDFTNQKALIHFLKQLGSDTSSVCNINGTFLIMHSF